MSGWEGMIKEHKEKLKPGSYRATLSGCSCPILSNNFGEGYYIDPSENIFYEIDSECPLHGDKHDKVVT
jgi:hypothetical protein